MKIITKNLFLLIIPLFISSISFSQNFIWSRGGIGDGEAHYGTPSIHCVTNDEKGSVYTAGAFVDKMQFGTTLLTSYTTGLADVFISKYDSRGNLKWVIQDGGISEDKPMAICYNYGYIYIVGQFQQTATFGSTTFNEVTGIASSFIVKYDTTGNFIWARTISGNFSSETTAYIYSINADDSGNIIMGGMKYGHATTLFDTIAIIDQGGFTTKYDSSGHALWVSMGICDVGICVNSVIADHAGNYYSTGRIGNYLFTGSTPAVFGTDTIYSHAYTDIFLAKYNSEGMPIWAQSIGNGWYMDEGNDLAVDSLNNIYLAGSLDDSVFGKHLDFMISKYDPTGNLIWMKNTSGAYCRAISADKTGNIYFTGNLNGSFILNNDTLVPQQTSIVAGKLDLNGNTIWITINSNIEWNSPSDISVSPQGNSFITGNFISSVRFGQDLLMGLEYRPNLFITMLNDTSIIPTHNNLIKGNIFNDIDNNCIKDAGENGIVGYSVMAQPGNIFAVSDIDGNYTLRTDSGAYAVSQLLPVSHSVNASQICPALNGSYTVNAFSSNTIYTGYDFADNVSDCPVINISFGNQQGSILCDNFIQTNITITNYGLVFADNIQLTVEFSSAFIPVSSSPAWSSYVPGDTTLIFNLGTIPPNSFSSITINDSVTCTNSNYLWIPYVHYASITPVNSCTPSDSSYCTDTLIESYFIPVGLSNTLNENAISVYPNPSNGKFIFKGLKKENRIEIYDITGRLIYQIFSNENFQTIDLKDKDKGIYIYRITNTEKELQHGKILLQ